MEIVQLINDYWPVIIAIGALLDAVAGYLPDRWIPYLGLIKRIAVMLKGGKGGTAAVLALLLLAGCSGGGAGLDVDDHGLDAYVGTKAYQIGLLVGRNNPGLYAVAQPYYEDISGFYQAGINARFYQMVDTGLQYVVGKYVSDPLVQEMIVAEVKSLAAILGLDGAELPDLVDIETVRMDRAMAVVEQFMAGLQKSAP